MQAGSLLGPGVDAVVVEGADGKDHVAKRMSQGAPSHHVNDGCEGEKRDNEGASDLVLSAPLTESGGIVGALDEARVLLQVVKVGVSGGLGWDRGLDVLALVPARVRVDASELAAIALAAMAR